ncbi:MAG: hypothetical protein K2P67_09020 [Gallionellaceae bacterium]|nr:hypothetical protein [Gallionellaceae bacterium]
MMTNVRSILSSGANAFLQGFIKGAKETPRGFFAPAIAAWSLLISTADSLVK